MHANPVLLEAEKAYKNSSKQLSRQFELFLAELESADRQAEWKGIHTQWKEFAIAQSNAHAGITSGGGSAFSTDYLSLLTDLQIGRTAYYRNLVKVMAGEPKKARLNE